jgi:hypothetical protein
MILGSTDDRASGFAPVCLHRIRADADPSRALVVARDRGSDILPELEEATPMNAVKGTSAGLVAAVLLATALVGSAQDKPANNLEAVHEQLKADKKVIIGKYMSLTGAEANAFWPVYEEYQSDLQKINQRLVDLLQSYATDYRSDSLTDEKAQKLLDEWIAIESDDAKRRASYVPKVLKVLPPKKAARYLQIENEYRTLLKYDLAVAVPLVR